MYKSCGTYLMSEVTSL